MKVPLMCPSLTQEMKDAAIYALENERFVLGESVYKFEEDFAKYCGASYAVSTSSGTNALQIALIALKAKDKEVVVPSASFIATANAAIHAGGKPVFADINLDTYTLDPSKIGSAAGKQAKGVIPVHLYGFPAEMDTINEIARSKNLFVVEDAAQAHGALYKARKVGSLSDAACFSFYTSKNMTVCGDGGMIVTSDKKLAETAAKLRDCGRTSRYIHDIIGYTSRLNTMNAAIGRVQLRHLDEWNKRRRAIAKLYCSLLSGVGDLILPSAENSKVVPVYHLFVIRSKYRERLRDWLAEKSVESGIHYPVPIHLQPIYKQLFKGKVNPLPNTEELSSTCLSLPLYPSMVDGEVKYVAKSMIEFFENIGK